MYQADIIPLEGGSDDDTLRALEDDENDKVEKKDWFGPAIASMARLNQIQASVYNMGLHNPSVLKPLHKVRRNQQEPAAYETKPAPKLKIQDQKQVWENETDEEFPLRIAQPSPIYKETAWGSNHSIPELLARQTKPGITRPSSAKILNECRLKTVSAAKLKGRPQSAKEPLCLNGEPEKQRNLGVIKGSKKNVLPSKPPSRPAAPVKKHPLMERAWAGPPPGYEMHRDQVAEDGLMPVTNVIPTAPCSSPTLSDDDESNDKTFTLLRRPLPTPIHLSLPSVNDVLDLNRDEESVKQEPDTDRLLKEAEHFMKKQQEGRKTESRNILESRNATLPKTPISSNIPSSNSSETSHCTSTSSKENLKTSQNYDNLDRSYKINEKTDYTKADCQMKSNKIPSFDETNDLNNSRSLSAEKSREKTETFHNANSASKQGVKIREDRNITVDITPRNIGRKVIDKKASFLNETTTNLKNNFKHSNCPCDITLEDLSLTDREKSNLIHYKNNNNNKVLKRPPKEGLVSMVTVEYEEADQSTKSDGKKKSPVRKKKPMSEIETLVSQLSNADSCDINSDLNGALSVCELLHKSKPERNYYELARNRNQGSIKSVPQSENSSQTSDDEENAVYKTTKTVEFNPDNIHESSIRSVISGQTTSKIKREPPVPISYTLKQTKHKDLKGEHLTNSNNSSTAKGSSQMTAEEQRAEAEMDELEDILQEAKVMAQSSINDASRGRPPNGKMATPKNKPRPSSSKLDKSEAKSKPNPSLARASSLSDIDKVRQKPQSQHNTSEHKKCCRHSVKLPPSGAKPTKRPATAPDDGKPVIISSIRQRATFETPSSLHCKEMQSKMSALGLNINSDILERALFPPSGNNLYYDVSGEGLPKNTSDGLLPHYKYWLPEDYKRIKTMEKRLAQDDHIKYLQELAAKKKAKKAAAKLKGKKKKKEKLERRNSVC